MNIGNIIDFSIVPEVLLEKGYLHILAACVFLLIVLLIIRKFLPKEKLVDIKFDLPQDRIFLMQPVEVAAEIVARKKVTIEEFCFYAECIAISPDQYGHSRRLSYYFDKNVVLTGVVLYPKLRVSESSVITIPEKDKSRKNLPGSFVSSSKQYAIVWEIGCSLSVRDDIVKTEIKKPVIVYPVKEVSE